MLLVPYEHSLPTVILNVLIPIQWIFKISNYCFHSVVTSDYSCYKKIYKESPNGKEKAQAAYYLMTFYFLVNDLDSARDLFGDAEFGVFEDYVLYYDILLDLYDGMVGDAREKYNRFMDLNRGELAERKNILNQIFDFIDDKIDTINLQSDYPIIKDIIERYAEE